MFVCVVVDVFSKSFSESQFEGAHVVQSQNHSYTLWSSVSALYGECDDHLWTDSLSSPLSSFKSGCDRGQLVASGFVTLFIVSCHPGLDSGVASLLAELV